MLTPAAEDHINAQLLKYLSGDRKKNKSNSITLFHTYKRTTKQSRGRGEGGST